MMDQQSLLNKFFREAEQHGTWCDYAVWCMGETNSGDPELDEAVANLYSANERLHRVANRLALRYDIDFFEGSRP